MPRVGPADRRALPASRLARASSLGRHSHSTWTLPTSGQQTGPVVERLWWQRMGSVCELGSECLLPALANMLLCCLSWRRVSVVTIYYSKQSRQLQPLPEAYQLSNSNTRLSRFCLVSYYSLESYPALYSTRLTEKDLLNLPTTLARTAHSQSQHSRLTSSPKSHLSLPLHSTSGSR